MTLMEIEVFAYRNLITIDFWIVFKGVKKTGFEGDLKSGLVQWSHGLRFSICYDGVLHLILISMPPLGNAPPNKLLKIGFTSLWIHP